jgi:pyridoxamine 5'-phosphate oxidase
LPPERPLEQSDLDPDPLVQFTRWYASAVEAGVDRPDAMALATATSEGAPSLRMVLFKAADPSGLVFYTNYQSRKAGEIAHNPRAAAAFYWPVLRRQVRIEGTVGRVSHEESARYFGSRPRDAQLAAWASRQSEPLSDRETLDRRFAEVAAAFEGRKVPLPPFWGGYRLAPGSFEFWQGREHRLHDRFRYTLLGDQWALTRLWP